MQLKTLGSARLESKKLSNLQLLILAFLVIEGKQNRNDLASLFFSHLVKPRESLRVAIAKLNQKIGKGSIIIDNDQVIVNCDVKCDVQHFRQLVEQEKEVEIVDAYEDYFFKGIEQDCRLDLTDDLYIWLMDLREEFAENVRSALLKLAQRTKLRSQQKIYAEKAYLIERSPDFVFEDLELLTTILGATKSRFAKAAEIKLNEQLAIGIFKHLDKKERNLLLGLAICETHKLPNSCVEKVFNQNSEALHKFRSKIHELLLPIDAKSAFSFILKVAQDFLDDYPNERNYYALKIAEYSPYTSNLFGLYESIYKTRNDFGNIQELPKHLVNINRAYREQALNRIEEQDFEAAQNLLAKIRTAEQDLGFPVSQENLFFEAYALERLGRFNKALEIISFGEDDDKVLSLKSVLLMRAKDLEQAEIMAFRVIDDADDAWARALAQNTLGTVRTHQAKYYEAIEFFSKAAIQWQLIRQNNRYLGALMNQASCYSFAGELEKAEMLYQDLIEKSADNSKLRTTLLINKADTIYRAGKFEESESILSELHEKLIASQAPQDEHFCRVLANLGYSKLQQEKISEAKDLFDKARIIAYDIGDNLLQANSLMGLGEACNNLSYIDDALCIYSEMQHSYFEISKAIYITVMEKLIIQAVDEKNPGKLEYLLSRFENFLKSRGYKKKHVEALSKIHNFVTGIDNNRLDFILENLVNDLSSFKLNLIN